MAFSRDRIRRLARDRLGFEELRPGQVEGVESIVGGTDTLCVMSTGSGKTAIYQLAGMLLEGPTIVVSPLISLQRDQVAAMQGHKGAEAVMLNSTLGRRARERALEETEDGEVEFLLLSPEQLARRDVLEELRGAGPSLFVVDEAHCVSQWGHDFRPEYLHLAAAVEAVGSPVVLALTATAAPPVRADIAEVLGMRDPAMIVRGFDRPNIHFAVHRFYDAEHKRRELLDAIVAAEGPGLVYVATKRTSEEVAAELVARGVRARAYHGGLGARLREQVQDAFMADRECDVVVATVAFGMGVDKPNVRWVFHEAVSESVDAYYQEIGRAGRDGQPARAQLFYREEDLGLRRFFSGGGASRDEIDRIARLILLAGRPVDPAELVEVAHVSHTRLENVVHRLEDAGAVAVGADGRVTAVTQEDRLERAVQEAATVEHERREFELSRVEMMRAYAERHGCRRAFLLGYFGESFDPPCGNCDNCDRGLSAADTAERDSRYSVGIRVAHPEWGRGTVAGVQDGHVTVVFDAVGYKTLDEALATERSLLHPLPS
jgi:ATP-dependent DNA helicase RecQ